MDPQMVWDMMDEEEVCEKQATLCQSAKTEVNQDTSTDKAGKKSSAGWMGFPVYGVKQ